jgi:glycosyltransferase involved in cell wall biosynthesis
VNITIGITTYNRFSYLLKMKQSLLASNGLARCNIRVYDDCSTDYGVEDINRLFPNAKEVIVRPINIGPCANMHQMYIDFLNTKDSLLVAADSDLLFNPDWIDFVLAYFPKTDGILSLYNSVLHRPRKEICIGQVKFLQKMHLGSAGVVMHRDIVQEIVNNVPSTKGYDWAWSSYLCKTGKSLLVSKISYVQHIGLYGYNCDGFKTLDFGLNFYPGNKLNEQFLVDYFQNSLLTVKTVEETIKIKNIKRTKKTLRKLRRVKKHSKEQLELLLNGSFIDKWC